MRYRDGLATTLAGAAIPYGYTLVVWSSGSVVGERHGSPDLWEIALFFAGASAAMPCCASWCAVGMFISSTGLAASTSSQRVPFKGRPSLWLWQ